MSSYKVAQDVEADDKLLGPFSFRQFIYLIIVALSGFTAWGLWSIFQPLVIIPIPVMLFFGALALPLRKDQPMETYLAALISFYLKPRKRLWSPDGIVSLVEITVPQTDEAILTKNLSEAEAARRLAYLADLSDSQGWSIRNVTMPSDNTSMRDDIYNEATRTEDPLDDDSSIARSFDSKIADADSRYRQELMTRMSGGGVQATADTPAPAAPTAASSYQATVARASQAASSASAPQEPQSTMAPSEPVTARPQTTSNQPTQNQASTATPDAQVQFNPYPTSIRQTVIQPLSADDATTTASAQAPEPPEPDQTTVDSDVSTSENRVSPDIINLANNSDLSIETIAREANRVNQKKHEADNEVVISLR